MYFPVWNRLSWLGRGSRPIRLYKAIEKRAFVSEERYKKSLHEFMGGARQPLETDGTGPAPIPPYLPNGSITSTKRYFIETYGCQMNYNDTEVVMSIMEGSHMFVRAPNIEDADVILLMTCAIRENAESKVWARLESLKNIEKQQKREITVGVLGCMAERLKVALLEKTRTVDVVCGPDAYRDLPRLLMSADEGSKRINVMLSADETYADIAPIRLDPTKKSAFVSIMRGCNNMCAFCIVPFTRGRERSRPAASVVDEIRGLSESGIKEVTLLGQNVNSYSDDSIIEAANSGPKCGNELLSRGFKAVYKTRARGLKFVELLEKVSAVDPEMRIRFTSPHPKDFPDDLLVLMRERHNICKQIHLPAQSGSTTVLERMRRGYSREAYLELVEHIRAILPRVALSSDFIVGFCGETEAEHQDTLSLVNAVGYDMAYMFAYSMREKTMAHRRYQDDVPEDVKQRRLRELIDLFYTIQSAKARAEIGTEQLVLVEGPSKKSETDLFGRTDEGRSLVFKKEPLFDASFGEMRQPIVGDYVLVRVETCKGSTPVGKGLAFSGIREFSRRHPQS